MHFLNVNKVVKDLRYGALDEKESSKYLIGTLIIEATSIFGGNQANDVALRYKVLSFLLSATIIIFGIRMCYRANKESGDKDFLKRYFCLAFPIGLWISLFVLILTVALGFIAYFATLGQPLEILTKAIYFPALVIGYLLAVGKYIWIKKSIQKLSKI